VDQRLEFANHRDRSVARSAIDHDPLVRRPFLCRYAVGSRAQTGGVVQVDGDYRDQAGHG
jgi:hypothetical protein